jgi:hypothetical protein
MGLSDAQQSVFVAVGSGALAVEGFVAASSLEPTLKASLMVLFGSIAVGAFAIKDALGGKAPATPAKVP